MTAVAFDYAEMIGRNAGFLSERDQERLRTTPIFICGAGGMGGAALQSLVRAGAERLAIADFDCFEASNLNRQVFSGLSNLGLEKTAATAQRIADINPRIEVRQYGRDWTFALDAILGEHRVVINGMDDIAAGIHLYRRARVLGATIIDAYTAPIPSVTVVSPTDPRPEERLQWPTVGEVWDRIPSAHIAACKTSEILYVLTHSSAAEHIDPSIAADLLTGRRPRPSFAPMVITTGNLMAYEAIKLALGWPSGVDCRGCFFNPMTFTIERPRAPWIAAVRRRIALRRLRELGGSSQR